MQDLSSDVQPADSDALAAAPPPRRADYDDFYGGELSVPIIYEPYQ